MSSTGQDKTSTETRLLVGRDKLAVDGRGPGWQDRLVGLRGQVEEENESKGKGERERKRDGMFRTAFG